MRRTNLSTARVGKLFLLAVALALSRPALSPAQTVGASLTGTVSYTNSQGESVPISGATVTLSLAGERQPRTTLTDEQGSYTFADLPPGLYNVEVAFEGFQADTKTVELRRGESQEREFTLRISTVTQTAEVREEATEFGTETASSTETVTDTQLETLPIPQHTDYTASLSVVPGVVQNPNGTVDIKGVSETQGMLLVDSAENVDPVTGAFSVPLPVDSVQSLSVFEAPYSAEYGGFSGGLTDIDTRPPAADRWQFSLKDFFPGFRGKNGHLVGVSEDNARAYLTGPLDRGKLNFSQAIGYTFRRVPVRGLAWPHNEVKTQGVAALTTLQAIFSSRHVLTADLNVFTRHVQFADINALLPQLSSADNGQHGFSAWVNDNYQFGSGVLLNTVVKYTLFESEARGQGPLDLEITPEGWSGNYFNAWYRTSRQYQVLPSLRFPLAHWHGTHDIKAGFAFSNRFFDGSSQSHPIQLLRENGTLAEEIDFAGVGHPRAGDSEVSEYIRDHWKTTDYLAVDLGGRLVSQSAGRPAAFAPRGAVTFSPTKDGRTTISAGAGIFYERVPLLAADFTQNPTRVVSFFNAGGTLMGAPVAFENVYLQPLSGGGWVPTAGAPNQYARNFTWNAELDEQILQNMAVRVSYLRSETQNLPVIVPVFAAGGGPSFLGLANTGTSRYNEIQVALHYQPVEREIFDISYVHSSARGSLNALADLYTPLEQPVIRPDAVGILPSDVPDRVVAWGMFIVPFKLTVSPVVDIHTGLPYSPVDDLQSYVGAPDSARYPYYFSLDLQVYKEFPLSSLPLMGKVKNHTFRFGIFSINVTSHKNPNAVYNDVTSPLFGTFAGFDRRMSGFVFELF